MLRGTCIYLKTTIIILLLFVTANARASNIYDYSAGSGKNYVTAEFRLWLPESSKPLQAVLLVVPGWNGDGRDAVHDSVWQTFAKEHNLALVACHFKDKPDELDTLEGYCNVSMGSGQALLDALSDFSVQSSRPEIANAPLLLMGFSAGGQFNYEFTAWKPERVIAFVVNKGGYYFSGLLNKTSRSVPGLLFTGKKDQEFRQNIIKGLFCMNQRAGALWALIQEPGIAHGSGRSVEMALVFYNDMLRLRLDGTSQKPDGQTDLSPISPETGYQGDLESQTYTKFNKDQKAPERPVAWLATEEIAQLWQKIITGQP